MRHFKKYLQIYISRKTSQLSIIKLCPKITHFVAKFYNLNDSFKKTFLEHIFSIKNHLIYNKKYKVITILGLELKFLTKEYRIG